MDLFSQANLQYIPPSCISFLFNSIESLFNQIFNQLFEYFVNIFAINMHPISFRLNLVQLEFKFNTICMQCHSIFSFKWNFNWTKSLHCFHEWINWLLLVVHKNVDPKLNNFVIKNFKKWNKIKKLSILLESFLWMDFLEVILYLDLRWEVILS